MYTFVRLLRWNDSFYKYKTGKFASAHVRHTSSGSPDTSFCQVRGEQISHICQWRGGDCLFCVSVSEWVTDWQSGRFVCLCCLRTRWPTTTRTELISLPVQRGGGTTAADLCDCFHRSRDEVSHSREQTHTDTFNPELWHLAETQKRKKKVTDFRLNKRHSKLLHGSD